MATIRWDRDGRSQDVDLGKHKNWDHGYAETVYYAQSKTYDRVYVLAPINSALVTGHNYYTAITRARFGVKLWTEDVKRLAEKLERRPGEKTSALEGLGRIARDGMKPRGSRHSARLDRMRAQQSLDRELRRQRLDQDAGKQPVSNDGPARALALRAAKTVDAVDRWLMSMARQDQSSVETLVHAAARSPDRDGESGHDR